MTDPDRTKLPMNDPEFTGAIGATYLESEAAWPEPPKPPAGAPNVVIILLDDVGFGQVGTFGGPVPTPALDKLAAKGLRYNRFHTTAICGPSRAALLTGRNHHNCGSGFLAEWATGFPSYTTMIPKSTATVAKILKENGYNTAWFGKNHNTDAVNTFRTRRCFRVAYPDVDVDRWVCGKTRACESRIMPSRLQTQELASPTASH